MALLASSESELASDTSDLLASGICLDEEEVVWPSCGDDCDRDCDCDYDRRRAYTPTRASGGRILTPLSPSSSRVAVACARIPETKSSGGSTQSLGPSLNDEGKVWTRCAPRLAPSSAGGGTGGKDIRRASKSAIDPFSS